MPVTFVGERAKLTHSKVSVFRFKSLVPYLLLLPAFTVLGIILIYPLVKNIYLSLWQWRLLNPSATTFVALRNYIEMFSDPLFWQVVRFTLVFTGLTIGGEFLLGIGSALLLNWLRKGKGIVTTLMILPYMVAPISVGLTWRLLWLENGIINYFLSFFSIQPIEWLVDITGALAAVSISQIWRFTPFVTMILLAGLTSMPTEIFDAAEVDGASKWQVFWRLTLPLLRASITVALLFQTIFTLRVFDIIYILTGGGPGTETLPLGILIYKTYFRYMDGGAAASLSVFLLILGALVSLGYIRFVYKETEA